MRHHKVRLISYPHRLSTLTRQPDCVLQYPKAHSNLPVACVAQVMYRHRGHESAGQNRVGGLPTEGSRASSSRATSRYDSTPIIQQEIAMSNLKLETPAKANGVVRTTPFGGDNVTLGTSASTFLCTGYLFPLLPDFAGIPLLRSFIVASCSSVRIDASPSSNASS